MSDLISRQAVLDYIDNMPSELTADGRRMIRRIRLTEYILDSLPSAQPESQWIPFKTRPLTAEEREEHPEWDCVLECKLPDDGQRILVSINLRGHEKVQYDEFYTDDGSYLDSGYEIGSEATAWMPLPEPYKGEKHE